jgi:hybrid cluster-associated redox disulfide protein
MTNSKEQKVTKEMPINDIINNYPDLIPLLMGYGLHCVGCSFSGHDTLESGSKLHGMSDEDVGLMVQDCNELLAELEKD